MPDDIVADQNNQDNTTVLSVEKTSEVLDSNGNSIGSHRGLADFLDKVVASGKPAKEILAEEAKVKDTKEGDKEIEKKSEPKDETPDVPENEEQKEEKKEEVDPRKELLKQTDVKAKEPAKDTQQPEVSEDELAVLPHDKPKTAKRIQALLDKANKINSELVTTKEEAKQKAEELKKLQDQLNSAKSIDPNTLQEIERQKEELAMFRRRYELDKDPEVKTKYDSRIESAEAAISSTISKYKGGEEFLKLVKQEGGWGNFAQSGRLVTLADGTRKTAAEIADVVYNELATLDKRAIDAALIEQAQTKRDRDRFFDEQTKTALDYFKKRDEEANISVAEQNKKIEEARKEIEEFRKRTVTENEWLKLKEIPSGASTQEKAAIEEDNKITKQLHKLLEESLNQKTVKQSLEVVLDSVRYYQERRVSAQKDAVIKQQQAEISELKEKIDKFKGASRTVKSGSISSTPASQTQEKRKPQGLEEELDAMFAAKNE